MQVARDYGSAKVGVNPIAAEFERGFLAVDLSRQVDNCHRYELHSLFMNMLPLAQPILEAGCGGGKWLHYFKRLGLKCVGIDWSSQLQKASMAHDPDIRFDVGDLRNLPYADSSFGSILALGSIEHVIEGPATILQEFRRVLKPGGVAIITVPYLSMVRRLTFAPSHEPLRRLKRSHWLRQLAGKQPLPKVDRPVRGHVLARPFRQGVFLQSDFNGDFYQYQFSRFAFEEELIRAGLELKEVFFVGFKEGLKQTFGTAVGYKDPRTGEIRLNRLGRCVARVVGEGCPHMIGAIAVRPQLDTR